MDPMTMMAAAGAIGGLFSKGPSIPKEQKRLLNMQFRAGKELEQFSKSVPMSDPGERAALASQRALMGQQQMGAANGLFANLGAEGATNPQAMMRDLQTQFQGQQSAIMSQHFLNSLAQRRNALLQSAQVAAGAVPASQQTQQGLDFGSILGPLAQQWGYQQGMKGLQARQPGTINRVGTGLPPAGGFPQRSGPMGLFG